MAFTKPDGTRGGKWTLYSGTWFRSSLESSWAECWDASGILWLYESHRYLFADGSSYLVDFHLPERDVFVEVKPVTPTIHELYLARTLSTLTGCLVYVASGKPWQSTVQVYAGGWGEVDRMELFRTREDT